MAFDYTSEKKFLEEKRVFDMVFHKSDDPKYNLANQENELSKLLREYATKTPIEGLSEVTAEFESGLHLHQKSHRAARLATTLMINVVFYHDGHRYLMYYNLKKHIVEHLRAF